MSRLVLLVLLLLTGSQTMAESWSISASEWARPRHGDWLVRQPALVATVEQLQAQPTAFVQLRYPGGDEGVLWAEELHSWLVALGVGSDRIDVVPGSGAADRIELRVVEP
ncbi:MAG: hypothetical protein ACQETD_02120 [Pseudomonadota bacterium]